MGGDREILGIHVYCVVDVVALEADDDGSVAGWVGKSGAEDFKIAFVDGLAERDTGVSNDLRVSGRVHEHGCVGEKRKQILNDGRDGFVVGKTRFEILGAFFVDERAVAEELDAIEPGERKE